MLSGQFRSSFKFYKMKIWIQKDKNVSHGSKIGELYPRKAVFYDILIILLGFFCVLLLIFYRSTTSSNCFYFNITVKEENIPRQDGYRIVCYYIIPSNTSWIKTLPPNSVDPYFCTHVITGFAAILKSQIAPSSTDMSAYEEVIKLKKNNPNLKVLLSVADMTSYGEFSKMVSSEFSREKFVNSTLKFLNDTGFDGLDLDWEFPSWPDSNLNQVRNFTFLLKELRNEINSRYKHLLISAAVAAPSLIVQQSYEIPEMSEYVDFVNLMSYDYHMYSYNLPVTGPNSPLYSSPHDGGYLQTLNINWSANKWVEKGMPKYKINIGVPTYGHSFTLTNEDNNGWNAPAIGFGQLGKGGFISYADACNFTNDPTTTHLFDDSYQVPYAFNKKEWISYENALSVQLKADYIRENVFGGVMIFSLNTDDFATDCGPQAFPLTRAILKSLDKLS